MTEVIVYAHAFATVCMSGLIWFVQVVHYPLYAKVGADAFGEYHHAHVRQTTTVVAPLMLTEVATGSWLAIEPPTPDSVWATTTGFVLLLVVWISTAVIQIPCHGRLEREGPDPATIRRLVRGNWIRTAAWTLRAGVALYLCRL